MEHRPLGRTGVSVSKLCLGAMMFGAVGQPRPRRVDPDHPPRARRRHQLRRHRRRLLAAASRRRSSARRWPAAGATTSCSRPRSTGRWATDPNQRGNSRRWIIREVEDSLRRLDTDWIDLYQIHRPDPDTDIEETLGALTDLVHQGKVRYLGISTFPAVGDRRGAVGRARPAPRSASSASSRRTRSSSAASRPTCCRPARVRHGRHPVEPAGRRLAVGPLAQGNRAAGLDAAPSGFRRATTCRCPATSASSTPPSSSRSSPTRRASRSIQLAIAFVLNHPAVTAAIIGPRTMEHLESQLAAADVVLDEAVLDRIDEIVPPGTNLNPADGGWWRIRALEPAARRR